MCKPTRIAIAVLWLVVVIVVPFIAVTVARSLGVDMGPGLLAPGLDYPLQ